MRDDGDRHWLVRGAATAIVVGTLLRLPALWVEPHTDDHVQRAVLTGAFSVERSALDLFSFAGHDPDEARRLIDAGFHPWWTDPELRLSMFRPLASALIALDHTLFGGAARLHHLHSLLWWAALVIAAGLVLGRLLQPRVAFAALILFAVDECHTIPTAWLAQRGTLVATCFGFLALWAHLRWRDGGRRVDVMLEIGAAALALGAGEYGLAALAYVAAYEWLGRDDAVTVRVRACLPAAAVAAAYVGVRTLLGYGIANSGLYLSPLSEPTEFLRGVLVRIPTLAADTALGIPARWFYEGAPWRSTVLSLGLFEHATWQALPDWRATHVVIGFAALGLCAAAVRFTPRGARDRSRWLMAGALLSLLPGAGSLPSDRLLTAAALGVSAVVATLLLGVDAERRPRALSPAARIALVTLALIHLPWAALRSYGQSQGLRHRVAAANEWARAAPIPPDPAARVLLVAAADYTTEAMLPWVRHSAGKPLPRYYRRLSGAAQAHDLMRVSGDTLELRVLATDVGGSAAGSLYRPVTHPLHSGDRFELTGMSVHVLETRGGSPARWRIRFDPPLDDPSYVVLHPTPRGIERITLPAPGETLRLPRPAFPR